MVKVMREFLGSSSAPLRFGGRRDAFDGEGGYIGQECRGKGLGVQPSRCALVREVETMLLWSTLKCSGADDGSCLL